MEIFSEHFLKMFLKGTAENSSSFFFSPQMDLWISLLLKEL
jgi:hypothetical protein